MESASSNTLNVSLPPNDEENPSETPAGPGGAADTSMTDTSSTTAQHPQHDDSSSGCWITLLICVLVPSIVGLVVLFGIFAVPVIILACFGVSLFCLSPTPTDLQNSEQEEEFKNMTKSEMRERLLVRNNVQEGCCEICLMDFNEDSPETVVVASPNPSCCHVFHEECVLKWLEKKPTCPCCRALYLSEVVEQGQNQEEATSTRSHGDGVVVNLQDDGDGSIDIDSEPPEGWDVWIRNNMINESSIPLEDSGTNEEAEEESPALAR